MVLKIMAKWYEVDRREREIMDGDESRYIKGGIQKLGVIRISSLSSSNCY